MDCRCHRSQVAAHTPMLMEVPAVTEPPRPPGMDVTTWRFQNMGQAIIRREVEIQRLRGLLVRREVEIQRLRGLLVRLEWAGTVVFDEWYDKGRCCPVCRAEEGDPHGECWLAEELHP